MAGTAGQKPPTGRTPKHVSHLRRWAAICFCTQAFRPGLTCVARTALIRSKERMGCRLERQHRTVLRDPRAICQSSASSILISLTNFTGSPARSCRQIALRILCWIGTPIRRIGVAHLRRSRFDLNFSQPCRAGLTCAARPALNPPADTSERPRANHAVVDSSRERRRQWPFAKLRASEWQGPRAEGLEPQGKNRRQTEQQKHVSHLRRWAAIYLCTQAFRPGLTCVARPALIRGKVRMRGRLEGPSQSRAARSSCDLSIL